MIGLYLAKSVSSLGPAQGFEDKGLRHACTSHTIHLENVLRRAETLTRACFGSRQMVLALIQSLERPIRLKLPLTLSPDFMQLMGMGTVALKTRRGYYSSFVQT